MAIGCYVPEDHYLPASYNGIGFFAQDVTSEHGRRFAIGEFPFSEQTAVADLGRRIRTYSIRGEFRENNHVEQAALLIAAIEIPGAGVLIHPTRGVLTVICSSLRVSDNPEQAGVTSFDAQFTEANIWPSGFGLGGTILGLAIGAIIAASRTSFVSRYSPNNSPFYRAGDVRQTASDAIGQIRTRYGAAIATDQKLSTWRVNADLKQVEDDSTLLSEPEIVDRAIALGSNAVAQQTDGDAQYQAFRSLANWAAQQADLVPAVGGESQDAVYSHVRILSAAYMAQALTEVEATTMSAAFERLDAVTAILEDEERIAYARCDNQLFIEIRRFKNEVGTLLYNQAYNLPRLIEYNFNGSVHPLEAAYAIYGDAKRVRDIERSNLIGVLGRVGPQVLAAS